MSDFDSLTWALEDWFNTALGDMPDPVRQRVERDFFPMPWDSLSADQRRSAALRWDYKHDPANEQDRQFWWDFFVRQSDIEEQVVQWESVSVATAGDLAQKEARLAELRQELGRMERQRRQTRGDYYPKRPNAAESATSNAEKLHERYIAYPKALSMLAERLKAAPDEIAAWVWVGPKEGGIAAYLNANELDPPPRFYYDIGSGDDFDYLSPLMACWFGENDLANFEPADRYITGKMLIERWSDQPGIQPEAFIRAKIKESRLLDAHPICGGTQGTFPQEVSYPPLTSGLFVLSHVEEIEAEDFGIDANRKIEPKSNREREATSQGSLDQVESGNLCGGFRAMLNLDASEVSITFVGDKGESGLAANNMLEISARKVTKRVSLASLDLVDRRRGTLNSQAAILLGMAQKIYLKHSGRNARKMTRMREVFRKHLGIATDPFDPYRKGVGWEPRFAIVDKRGAADDRAKRDAAFRTDLVDSEDGVSNLNKATFDEWDQAARDGGGEPDSVGAIETPDGDDADSFLKRNDSKYGNGDYNVDD